MLIVLAASMGLANFGCAQGPFPHSSGWYADRANDPPGCRQIDSHGKLWPPYPRPTGRPQTILHTYHYAHYWPFPHNCEDEAYTRNILDIQTAGGWANATTLHDYHFNADTQQLTEGGRQHLMWVALSAPLPYRAVYIAQGQSQDTAKLRLEAAQQYYQEMGIDNPPPICAKPDQFEGRPAVEIDRIRQLELQAIPKPRLFYIGSATAGQTAGGGVPGGAGGPVGGAGATTTQSGSGFN